MSGRRRVRAGWLLLVLFTGMSLGVCTMTLSAAGGKLPCCEDLADGRASLTACCTLGESSSLDFPVGLQEPLPPLSEIAFDVAPKTSCDAPPPRESFSNIPYRSADPQAFFSTFLI